MTHSFVGQEAGDPVARFLLGELAGVLANRQISEGNAPFLESRFAMLRSVSRRLGPEGQWVRHATMGASGIGAAVSVARAVLSRLPPQPRGSLQNVAWLAPLDPMGFDRVRVVFTPEIGIGDELTFFQLLKRLPASRSSIHSSAAPLWRVLGFEDAEAYDADPVRPLIPRPGELTVRIGFLTDSWLDVVTKLQGAGPAMEVTLGKQEVRYWQGGPMAQLFRPRVSRVNNYEFVRALTGSCFVDGKAPRPFYCPASRHAPSRRKSRAYAVLVNPTTSKRMVLDPGEWAQLVRRAVPGSGAAGSIEVRVLSGFTPGTAAYAAAIAREIERRAGAIHARALPLTPPEKALTRVVRLIRSSDVVVGIDTFTAHLAPLLGVPTTTFAYGSNQAFWVPAPHALTFSLEAGLENVARALDATRASHAANGDARRIRTVTRKLLRWAQSPAPRPTSPTADFREILGSRERVRAALGRERYGTFSVVSATPRLFGLQAILDGHPIDDPLVESETFEWVSSLHYKSLDPSWS